MTKHLVMAPSYLKSLERCFWGLNFLNFPLHSTMSGLQCLTSENIWFDKHRYDEAEKRFYEGANGPAVQQQQVKYSCIFPRSNQKVKNLWQMFGRCVRVTIKSKWNKKEGLLLKHHIEFCKLALCAGALFLFHVQMKENIHRFLRQSMHAGLIRKDKELDAPKCPFPFLSPAQTL